MSSFYSGENLPTPVVEETFRGADSFGARCVDIGLVALKIIHMGREDISTQAGRSAARINAVALLKSQIFNANTRNPIADYNEHLNSLIALHAKGYSNEELFQKVFKISADSNVDATWLAGGLIFWCDEDDYRRVFVELRESDTHTSIQKADNSAAVAFGEIYVEDVKKYISVGIVKYERETKEDFYDTAVPGPRKLDEIESIYLQYSKDGVVQENVILKTEDDAGVPAIRVIDLIVEQEYEKTEDLPLTGPILLDKGPYSILIHGNTVNFVHLEPSSEDGSVLEITHTDNITESGELKQKVKDRHNSFVIHELQHLLNSLYTPIRLKKERFPGPNYDTKEKIVEAAADFLLKGPLDKRLRDEFLAQLIGGRRDIDKIADLLVAQVENMGVLYNYLSDEIQISARAINGHRAKFPNSSSGTYQVLARASEKYNEAVHKVAGAVSFFEIEYKVSRKELVAYLAPHPFHTWPTVLRAISRHFNDHPVLE